MACTELKPAASGILGVDAAGIKGITIKDVGFGGPLDCNSIISAEEALHQTLGFDPTCGIVLRVAIGAADCGNDCLKGFYAEGLDLLKCSVVKGADGLPALYLITA